MCQTSDFYNKVTITTRMLLFSLKQAINTTSVIINRLLPMKGTPGLHSLNKIKEV